MTLELATARCDFPDIPDWAWLRWHWQGHDLLRERASLLAIARRERGRTACLATAYDPMGEGPTMSADAAAVWLMDLAAAGLAAHSPAFQAGHQGRKAAAPEVLMPSCDFVIVPPAVGWREAQDVWDAVRLALRAVKPVYLMEGCD